MIIADARHLPIASGTVQCCVTSPPYWGAQRDYGIAGQLGMETTPEGYVFNLGLVFDEVARILRPDGVLWLNLGDSYAAGGKGGGGRMMRARNALWSFRSEVRGYRQPPPGYKAKDLVGVPWMVAFELRRRGWYLRRDVIWAKPSATEPTRKDRPSVAHEYLFLFSRSRRYGYDVSAHPQGTVWWIRSDGRHGHHIATMPQQLVRYCVLAGSKPDDRVIDPFMGSGTTARVAMSLGRRAIGVDLQRSYIDLQRHRTRGLELEAACR